MSDKLWKAIPGVEEYYELSTDGEVRNKRTGKILKNRAEPDGYVVCSLTVDYRNICSKIHKALAECFIPNPENKPTVNHKNGDKHDYDLDNLEWATYGENNIHAVNTGLRTRTSNKRVLVRDLTTGKESEYGSIKECAIGTGVLSRSIMDCLKGKRKSAKQHLFCYMEDNVCLTNYGRVLSVG
jgi:hypothetical protein